MRAFLSEGRAERIGKNEALFRVVNERLEEVNKGFATLTNTFEIICECGELECVEQIVMLPAAYEAIRADASLFAVVPGHEVADIEQVVASHEGYNVVQKDSGRAKDIAEATDPRS